MSRTLFLPDALEGVVRAGDRRQFKLAEKKLRPAIEAASAEMLAGNVSLAGYHVTPVRQRDCVSYASYDVHLLLRSITKHFRRRFRISSPSRDQVVRGLIEGVLDATPGHVVRRDIRSFYETLPTKELQEKLAGDTATPPIIRDYMGKFFAAHCPTIDHVGIPRGTPISPLLADIVMQDFDEVVRSTPGVFRYYRFADDIIALTTESADELGRLMEAHLPQPMVFNNRKTRNVTLAAKDRRNPPPPVEFDYLGYRFGAEQTREKRDSRIVRVSLSERKVTRLKSRIMLAIKDHAHRTDWELLYDRMSFLTSNHRLLRGRVAAAKDSPYIRAGLYYNYRACGLYSVSDGALTAAPYDRRELKQLDGFYHSAIRRLAVNVAPLGGQIAQLRRLSFNRSYELKIHCDFTPERYAEIKSCWRNL